MFVAVLRRQSARRAAMVLNASVRQSRENATSLPAPQSPISPTAQLPAARRQSPESFPNLVGEVRSAIRKEARL
jgi:hypothetical protein